MRFRGAGLWNTILGAKLTEEQREKRVGRGEASLLAEGYPTLAQVLRGILNDPNVPDTGVRRIEINAFASGDATYNVLTVDSFEAQGGYLTNSDLS
jgi:hypothetical protein